MANEKAIQRQNRESTPVEVTDASHQPSQQQDQGASTGWSYRPNVDVFELPDEIRLVADLPGASANTINVEYESNVLTLEAPVSPRETHGATALVREYGIGGFYRQFEIHEAIEVDGISAQFTNGALTVHLPKTAQAKPRRVKVAG